MTKTQIKNIPNNSFELMSKEKLAWLAGLLQGEAHFTFDARGPKKVKTADYKPAPPIPYIKIEMVELDVMQEIASLLSEKVSAQKRKTKAGKQVYRVTIQQRNKTASFLKAVLPFIIGEKTRNKIIEMLSYCEAHKEWEDSGGRSKAARIGALAKAAKAKA